MGSKYSVNGFINAAVRRSGKTLLVEGPSDKQLIHSILIEANSDKASNAIIDHAGMFDDQSLQGLGNKQKVLEIRHQARELAKHFPRLANALATLTDREWDEISFCDSVSNVQWAPPEQSVNIFTTYGHSMENYGFYSECLVDAVKYFWPDLASKSLLSSIEDAFDSIVFVAVALSVEMRKLSCIGRCAGLVKPSHLKISCGRLHLEECFAAACQERQIPFGSLQLEEFNASMDIHYGSMGGQDFARWLPHGHIGNEIIWSSVAKLCQITGFPSDRIDEVAYGLRKEKSRFNASWISKCQPDLRHPLDDVATFLVSD
jgi:hypothetical protein